MGRCFCNTNAIIKNAMEKLKRFYKMASRNVSNSFTVASRCVYCHKGIILKKNVA
jgi:hypothetical protein